MHKWIPDKVPPPIATWQGWRALNCGRKWRRTRCNEGASAGNGHVLDTARARGWKPAWNCQISVEKEIRTLPSLIGILVLAFDMWFRHAHLSREERDENENYGPWLEASIVSFHNKNIEVICRVIAAFSICDVRKVLKIHFSTIDGNFPVLRGLNAHWW